MRYTLPSTVRKIIGIFLIVAFMALYALIAVTVAGATIATAPWYVHALYFLLTGLLWVVPAMLIISWMARD